MVIHSAPGKLHWNYFLALEQDLAAVSRYIEFCEPNFQVYSIELAHLLLASASEVDVLAKLLCERIAPTSPVEKIDQYKAILLPAIPDLPSIQAFVPRYGLSFRPWSNWSGSTNPDWWKSYNKVKHQRDEHFNKATIQNVLNSIGALLILNFLYYSRILAIPPDSELTPKETTLQLRPDSSFIRLDNDCYYESVYS